MPSVKCYFRFPNGRYCDKWAKTGSRFCHHHQPKAHPSPYLDATASLARLVTPEDLFLFIRESLNAVRMGALTPGQAYSIACLSDRWLKLHRQLDYGGRKRALQDQILASMLDSESAAAVEHEAALEEEAATANPAPPDWAQQYDASVPPGAPTDTPPDPEPPAAAAPSSVPEAEVAEPVEAIAAAAGVRANKRPSNGASLQSRDLPAPPSLDLEAATDRLIAHFQRQILNSIGRDNSPRTNGRSHRPSSPRNRSG